MSDLAESSAPAAAPSAPQRAARAAPWIVALAFAIVAALDLRSVMPNFDEGVYVLQAARMLRGEAPYRDFFYHQTPLYLYVLAAASAWAPGSLVASRLLSLVCTALTGIVIGRLARRLVPGANPLVAQVAFYCAPLQRFGLLALPNATMVLLSVTGMLALQRPERRGALWAGVAFLLALLVKPLDLPVVLAAVLTLASSREGRARLPRVALAGVGAGLCAWLGFHLASRGGFTSVLRLQAGRYAGRSGFQVMRHFADFREAMQQRGVTNAFAWNVSEHVQAFANFGALNANLWLLCAAAGGLWFARRELPSAALGGLWLWLWLLVPLAFSLWVWEPIWDHYFLQYLPPLAILAALAFSVAWRRGRRARAAALAVLAAYALLGTATRPRDAPFYARAEQAAKQVGRERYFASSPLIHVVAGTQPACGFVDPMNTYGEHCAAALARGGAMGRFRVSTAALIDCLGTDLPVVLDRYAFWFLEPPVLDHLAATRERIVFLAPEDAKRFDARTQGGSAVR